MLNDTTPIGADALSREAIRAIFLQHGFTIKEGQADLKPYVYEAAEALVGAALASAVQPTTTITPLEEQQMFDDWCPYKGNQDQRTVWAAAIDAANGMLLAAAPKAAPAEECTGDTLAIEAFQRFGVGPHTVTPYLSVDEPEGLLGYRFLCDALAMAFEAGRASRGQAPAPAIGAQAQTPNHPEGDLVITTNDYGHIVAVTRQDDEGRILKVLALSAPLFPGGKPIAPAAQEDARQLLTDGQIWDWWRGETGLEDCDLCKFPGFARVVRAVEARAAKEGGAS